MRGNLMVVSYSGGNQEFTTKDTKITKEILLFFVSFVLFVVKGVASGGA